MAILESTSPCGISSGSQHVSTTRNLPPRAQPPLSYANRGTHSRGTIVDIAWTLPVLLKQKGCAVAYQQVLGAFKSDGVHVHGSQANTLGLPHIRRHVGYRKESFRLDNDVSRMFSGPNAPPLSYRTVEARSASAFLVLQLRRPVSHIFGAQNIPPLSYRTVEARPASAFVVHRLRTSVSHMLSGPNVPPPPHRTIEARPASAFLVPQWSSVSQMFSGLNVTSLYYILYTWYI